VRLRSYRLPPTTEETDAFLKDRSSGAFVRVVGTDCWAPHYGERWGRYWLEVARYSDTKGYVYTIVRKRGRPLYVYRDWVIRAFNEDLPYDQIPAATNCRRSGRHDGDRSPLAAMGYLTLGRRFLGVVHISLMIVSMS